MKKIILMVLLFGFEYSAFSQTGWVVQPSGVNFALNKIIFINSLTGYIAGRSDSILKTTNAGLNWNSVFTADSVTELRDIFFLNENTGYAAGGVSIYSPGFYFSSTLVKTTNSGNNWFIVFRDTNQSPPMILSSVYFTSPDTGYIGEGLFSNGDSRLHKTIDGGITWEELSFDQNNGYPFSMHFVNNLTGFTAISYYLIKTTNGGLNWIYYNSPFYSTFLQNLFFINQNTGYACGGSQYEFNVGGESFIMKTTNSGDNWEITFRRFGINFYDLNSIYFPTNNVGYSVGSSLLGIGVTDTLSIILKTTDAGVNWGFQNSPPTALRSVYFFNADTGFAVGMNGIILKTTDGGGKITSNVVFNGNNIPETFSLSQNYPNPFNPKTIINYHCSMSNYVQLKVYDALGKEVATLVNEKQNAGSYSVEFDARLSARQGSNLPSGIYFYTLRAGEFTGTKRMILLK